MGYHYLICEGKYDGLDVRLLDKVIAEYYGKGVMIIPVGGDSSLKSVAEHYRTQLAQSAKQLGQAAPPRQVFSVQDRNFRSDDDVDKSWKLDSRHFIWHRHEVENYLLDSRIVARLFDTLKSIRRPRHDELPQGPDEAAQLMRQLAEPMLENHVGWLTYGIIDARMKKWVNLRLVGLPKKSLERRDPDREFWINHFDEEFHRLEIEGQLLADLEDFSTPQIRYVYDEILELRKAEEFWSSGQFLKEMDGHELMSLLFK
ncbi:MAG: hypothetical protein HQK60_19520, partial [Deltaproteobacteria bacterium]|nr:hypothetical protein [Deltaproteobacteria bacterium]